jgi:hypothetical protein
MRHKRGKEEEEEDGGEEEGKDIITAVRSIFLVSMHARHF